MNNETIRFSSFRLIGILTGRRLSEEELKENDAIDYLKVLNENYFYPFFSSFRYDGGLTHVSEVDTDFYNDPILSSEHTTDLKVSISAIVGKNGYGKSTLLELIYLANYNLGCHYKKLSYFEKHGEPIKTDNGELSIGDDVFYEKKKLNYSIFFEYDGYTHKLVFKDTDIGLFRQLENLTDPSRIEFDDTNLLDEAIIKNLEKLFYSIVVNYSIYGLNAKHLGKWINPLFHKNDGYTTPVVINPMRNDGDYNINKELKFANERMLFNIAAEQLENSDNKDFELFITEKQTLKHIRFKLKDYTEFRVRAIKEGLTGNRASLSMIIDVISEFFEDFDQGILLGMSESIPFLQEINFYLEEKFHKIRRTYDQYRVLWENQDISDTEKKKRILKKIHKDGSHIVFKFKRCIHFIQRCIDDEGFREIWEDSRESEDSKAEYDFSIKQILKMMKIENLESINGYLPPPIFSTEIILNEGGNGSEGVSSFGDLSSGEQQMINSIQTVTYHLNNLESVFRSSDSKRNSYECVQVIFDEIELYFHPEYQQSFIRRLLLALHRMNLGRNGSIKSLSILFSTHSPFILSDIPSQNILRLGLDERKRTIVVPTNDETFGANIHNLLANEFYMSNGFIGEFALGAVNKGFDLLNSGDELNQNQKEYITQLMSLVGEPILKQQLELQFQRKVGQENYLTWVDLELKRLNEIKDMQ